MSAKGKTRWFPRSIEPVRLGRYECRVRVVGMPHELCRWNLAWDGTGFLVPFPMVVYFWRGLTKKAVQQMSIEATN